MLDCRLAGGASGQQGRPRCGWLDCRIFECGCQVMEKRKHLERRTGAKMRHPTLYSLNKYKIGLSGLSTETLGWPGQMKELADHSAPPPTKYR